MLRRLDIQVPEEHCSAAHLFNISIFVVEVEGTAKVDVYISILYNLNGVVW